MIDKIFSFLAGLFIVHGAHPGFQVKDNRVFYKSCNEGSGCSMVVLKQLNSAALHIFSSTGYASDGQSVYYGTQRLQGVDAKTFTPIGHCWAKDRKHVFQHNRLVQGADASTFRPLYATQGDDCTFGVDKQHIVIGNEIFLACDASSLHLIKYAPTWQADKQCLYYEGRKIQQADPATFTAILTKDKVFTGFAKDKNQVYYMGKVVKHADSGSFRVASPMCVRDNHHFYALDGKVVAASRCGV